MDENPAPLRPIGLTTERRESPLGVDRTVPLLAWKLAATGRDRKQSAYRIRVVVDGDPTDPDVRSVWDSGVVRSAQSVDIPYGGEPLRSRTRYVWAVRVFDESDRDSGWSEPAWFETAFLDPSEWNSEQESSWIGMAGEPDRSTTVNLDLAEQHRSVHRITAPRKERTERVSFHAEFSVPEDRTPSALSLAADAGDGSAEVQAFVGGTPVPCDGSPIDPAVLRPGDNILEIAVRPAGEADGGDVALAARLDIGFDEGDPLVVATDGAWHVDGLDGPLAESVGLHGATRHGRAPATYRPSPYLRREFEVSAPVRRARLYATALGLYTARINGRPVGSDRLAPGWTDYATRVPYQTYDVTDHLVQGANVIGAVLGDGWYAGNVGWFGPFRYGDRRAFRARLEIEYESGERQLVVTDDGWVAGEGAIRYADLQNGEVVDARRAVDGWDRPGFDASGWSPIEVLTPAHGVLQAAVAPPIRVLHRLAPVRIERRPGGAFIVDFGQNLVGWVTLRVRGEQGRRVVLRHAEVLDHKGGLYLDALRSARATDEFLLRGDPDGEEFEPTFTVHGFRYCEVLGWPEDRELRPEDIVANVAYADMPPIGEFSCSDERLSRLQQNIVWGQRGNFLAVPTDCPQRDERLGWTGDAQVFAATAAFNYDVRTFLEKWLQDLRDAQFDDGAVPHVAPDVMSEPGRPAAGAAGWGDAIGIVPLELLRAYDDRRVVAECYPAVRSWLAYLEKHSTDHVRPDAGFADWLAITPTPRDLVSTAFFAYLAHVAGDLAAALELADDEKRWRELYARIRAAFRARFVHGGGRVVSGTQTAYVLALRFGLLEPEERPAAVEALVDEIAARNWHLTTGFLGTPFLLGVLSDAGRDDVAYRLLLQDSFPSWLYPVVHGDATTVWERWDSWSHHRGFQDPGMTSFNHYAYGAVGSWMYAVIGGIAPAEPGYRRIVIRPRPGGGLTWAKTALETPHGRVVTNWWIEDGGFVLEVIVPPNTSADVHLPGRPQAQTVGSGTHTFRTELPEAV